MPLVVLISRITHPPLWQKLQRIAEVVWVRVHRGLGDHADGIWRDELATDGAASFWCDSRKTQWHRRVQPESFLDASSKVRQRSELLDRHVVGIGECAADLVDELLHALWLLEELVRQARYQRRCRLCACDHEQRGIRVHLAASEAPALLLGKHEIPQINAFRVAALFEALGDAVDGVLKVCEALLV